jgi:hypothetical protein
LGDLGVETFDAIKNRSGAPQTIDGVRKCAGCNNYCDMGREERLFGFSFRLTDAEIQKWFAFSGEDVYWKDGWHDLETYENGSHRWMSAREASLVLRSGQYSRGGILRFSYFSGHSPECCGTPMLLEILLDGEKYLTRYIVRKEEEICFSLDGERLQGDPLKLTVRVNWLWKPSEAYGSADERELGLAVRSVRISETYPPLRRPCS